MHRLEQELPGGYALLRRRFYTRLCKKRLVERLTCIHIVRQRWIVLNVIIVHFSLYVCQGCISDIDRARWKTFERIYHWSLEDDKCVALETLGWVHFVLLQAGWHFELGLEVVALLVALSFLLQVLCFRVVVDFQNLAVLNVHDPLHALKQGRSRFDAVLFLN